ncbi:hypothetical protein [Chondromyces apiculatus]|nr:hypothetical protein [Chondromyces apiculatus]
MPSTPPAGPPAPASQAAAPVPAAEGGPSLGALRFPASTPPPATLSRPARVTNSITTLLLLAVALLLVAAATPPLLRLLAIGLDSPRVAHARHLPLLDRDSRRRAPEPSPARNGFFAPEETWGEPSDPLEAPPAWNRPPDPGAEREFKGRAVVGLARRDLTLLADPSPSAQPLGQIDEGAELMIMKDDGEWLLVLHSGQKGPLIGWTRRNGVALR